MNARVCAICSQTVHPERGFYKNEFSFCSMAHVREWMAAEQRAAPNTASSSSDSSHRPLHMCGTGGGGMAH